jgi:flagellar protein FliJ
MPKRGFRLGQVLDHKRRLEEQRELELQRLVAAEAQLRGELEDLHVRLDSQLGDVAERARAGVVDAAELEAASRYVNRLEGLMEQQRALLADSAAGVAVSRDALVLALQERRALELLQERQDSAARRESNRREERAVDDLNAARFGTGQGG